MFIETFPPYSGNKKKSYIMLEVKCVKSSKCNDCGAVFTGTTMPVLCITFNTLHNWKVV